MDTKDDDPRFKIARVTGKIAPGSLGEVMVDIRGGAEAYLAEAAARGQTFERGERVEIVEYYPPRTVAVRRPITQESESR